MSTLHVSIVGGGPLGCYAMERLAALLPHARRRGDIVISIFERTGRFGAGATHSDLQPSTSYMNRVASQICFAADESNVAATHLLPSEERATFHEWCEAKYRATGDVRYALRPSDIPSRSLHGEALRDAFERYVQLLSRLSGVAVQTHACEVVDIERVGTRFRLHVRDSSAELWADHVLLVTGHEATRPRPGSASAALSRHPRFVTHPYPLHESAAEHVVPPGCRVGVLGLGLTALDVLLALTEGRGGRFVFSADDAVVPRYLPSGREPAQVVAVSPSGLLVSARPQNEKAADGSARQHATLEHRGVFLNLEVVELLRLRHGEPRWVCGREVRQLDFDRQVFPLVVLEMAYVYYTTLLGEQVAPSLMAQVRERYEQFLLAPHAERDRAIDWLLAPIDAWFLTLAAQLRSSLDGMDAILASARTAFERVLYGDGPRGGESPWGHAKELSEHRFVWRQFFEPLASAQLDDAQDWQARIAALLRRDLLAAAQGNLRNPAKAASDGVWRDMRSVFSAIADRGGLTAASQRRFVEVYFRIYTRMSNGAGRAVLAKVAALVDAGILDLSIGPLGQVTAAADGFHVSGRDARHVRSVDVLIEGRVHGFDPERTVGPLYPNLVRRGLVRRWRNPGAPPQADFVPGAVDVTERFHPVGADGSEERRLTILGVPTEGLLFFQLSAARPQANNATLNNVATWANELVADLVGQQGVEPCALTAQ